MSTDQKANRYRGYVIDRMTGAVEYRSRACTTWEDAQHRAETKAHGRGDRFAVIVIDEG